MPPRGRASNWRSKFEHHAWLSELLSPPWTSQLRSELAGICSRGNEVRVYGSWFPCAPCAVSLSPTSHVTVFQVRIIHGYRKVRMVRMCIARLAGNLVDAFTCGADATLDVAIERGSRIQAPHLRTIHCELWTRGLLAINRVEPSGNCCKRQRPRIDRGLRIELARLVFPWSVSRLADQGVVDGYRAGQIS